MSRILLINSGSKTKEFILQRMRELGHSIILVNKTLSWEKRYVSEWIQADTYNHEECLAKILKLKDKVHGVWTYWEDDVILAAKIAESLHLPGTSIHSAHNARNKYVTRTLLEKAGLNTPNYLLIKNEDELSAAIHKVTFPVILKPVSGSASVNVLKIENNSQLEEAKQILSSATEEFDPIFHYLPNTFLLEHYIPGTEYSIEGWVFNKTIETLVITEKSPVKEPYMIKTGSFIPANVSTKQEKIIFQEVRKGIRALGLDNTLFHAEVKMTPSGEPYIIEINARMCGTYFSKMIHEAYGLDLIDAGISISIGEKPKKDLKSPKETFWGAYLFHEELPTDVNDVSFLHPALYDLKFFRSKQETPSAAPWDTSFCGWVIARGETCGRARENLLEIKQSLRSFEL